MDPHDLLQKRLGGWFASSYEILELTNSLEAASLFGELCNQYSYYKKHDLLSYGMFFCTYAQLESKLKISAHKIRKAIKVLEKYNLISVDMRKDPTRGSSLNYFKIHTETMNNLIKKVKEPHQKSKHGLVKKVHGVPVKSSGGHIKKVHANNNILNNNISSITELTKTNINKIAEKYYAINLTWNNFEDKINSNNLIDSSAKSKFLNSYQSIKLSKIEEDTKGIQFTELCDKVRNYLKNLEL
jgi:hypothetical protein